MKKAVFVMLIVFIAAIALVIVTRKEPSETVPVLQMLALAPASKLTDTNFGWAYADYRALVAARPGAAKISTADEWLATQNNLSQADFLFGAAIGGVFPDDLQLGSHFASPKKMIKSIGVDPFSIERILYVTDPSHNTAILYGNFDPQQIKSSLEANKYTKQPQDYALWCSVSGCEQGTNLDLDEIDIGNPFGGEIGRKQPIALISNIIFSSANYPTMQMIWSTYQNKQESLADTPDYRAAIEAISTHGTLLQAYFDPKALELRSHDLLNYRDSLKALSYLPVYSLTVLAHEVADNKQLAILSLVYDTESDAQLAITALKKNLASFKSRQLKLTIAEEVQTLKGSVAAPEIYTSRIYNKSIVMFVLTGPLESETIPLGKDAYERSGALYRYLVTFVYGNYPILLTGIRQND